jgi:CRISPR-associated protein (TIGR03986 family)
MKYGEITEVRINNNGSLICDGQIIDFSRSGLAANYQPKKDDKVAFEIKDEHAVNVRLALPGEVANVIISDTPISAQAGNRFLNPYNFVRFITQARQQNHVLGDAPPPPHDRYIGLSGRITCTLEAVSPLFISDSHGVEQKLVDGKEHLSYRFFQVENEQGKLEPAIPASSLRGMVRSVFEAVTNSCASIFSDKTLSYHYDSRKAPWLIPARVEKRNDHYVLRLLTGTSDVEIMPVGDNIRGPQGRQKAGWVYKYWPIQPSKTLRHITNPRFNLREDIKKRRDSYWMRRARGKELKVSLKHGDDYYALIEEAQHAHPQIDFWDVLQLSKDGEKLKSLITDRVKQHVVHGWLCLNNQNIEAKHSERFFFSFIDPKRRRWPETIPLDPKVSQDYEKLIADYQDRHRDSIKRRIGHHNDPSTPEGNEPAYSRFIVDPEAVKSNEGDLVYVKLSGTVTNPHADFIVPVSVPRLAYKQSIGQLMSRHVRPCNDYLTLCPACRTFGWVYQAKPGEEVDPYKKAAYAGRVRLSHASLTTKDPATFPDITLAILSSPKPTTTQFYLLDSDGKPDSRVDYNTDHARLRGRKVYRNFGSWNKLTDTDIQVLMNECKQAVEDGADGRSDQNRTVRGALRPGARFEFQIEFENLMPLELGALLFSLQLKDGMVHRLGYAKPLGFGSVRLQNFHLQRLNWQDRLASLDKSAGWEDWDVRMPDLINDFLIEMGARYKNEFQNVIADLQVLLGEPPRSGEPPKPVYIHYPRPQKKPQPDGKQFEWFVGNKKKETPITLPLAKEEADPNNWLPYIDKDKTNKED